MARTEARLLVDIWNDPDFLALSSEAQRMFMFLLSQPELSHVGVMPLREPRWATMAPDLDADRVTTALNELAEAWFVVMDPATDELLLRSLFRRDKVYRQPLVLKAAAASLGQVRSPRIREVLVGELERVLAQEEVTPQCEATIEGMLATLRKALGEGYREGLPKGYRDGSRLASGGKGVVKTVTTDAPLPSPPPRAPDPRPKPSASERVVLGAIDATPEEARAVVALVNREAKPDRLVGFLGRLAKDGDLAEWLARVRASAERAEGPPCPKTGHDNETAINCRLCAGERKAKPEGERNDRG